MKRIHSFTLLTLAYIVNIQAMNTSGSNLNYFTISSLAHTASNKNIRNINLTILSPDWKVDQLFISNTEFSLTDEEKDRIRLNKMIDIEKKNRPRCLGRDNIVHQFEWNSTKRVPAFNNYICFLDLGPLKIHPLENDVFLKAFLKVNHKSTTLNLEKVDPKIIQSIDAMIVQGFSSETSNS